MLYSSKCWMKTLSFTHSIKHYHNLKSFLGYSFNFGSDHIIIANKQYSLFQKNLSKCSCGGKTESWFGNEVDIGLGALSIWRFGILPISYRTLKTKGAVSDEPQGIHENIKSLQMKTRLQRRKRLSLEEEDIKKPGYWNVVAFATAEEYNLEKLTKGLLEQNLYLPNPQPKNLVERNPTVPDVVYVTAKYQVGSEPREIYFFREGTTVFWNVPELESSNVLNFIRQFEENSYDERMVQDESEIMPYTCAVGKQSHLLDGSIILGDEGITELDKYTFSNAMALSVKLGIWEASLDRYVDSIEFVTEDLKRGTKISMSREEVLRKTGELFALRHVINLSSDLLDTPDFYWDHEAQENLYQQMCSYFSINRRTRVMNEKLNHCVELVELLSSHLSDRHHIRLEWMIIILIMVEVCFEVIHYVDRYM